MWLTTWLFGYYWSQTIKQTHQEKNLFCGTTCLTIGNDDLNCLRMKVPAVPNWSRDDMGFFNIMNFY